MTYRTTNIHGNYVNNYHTNNFFEVYRYFSHIPADKLIVYTTFYDENYGPPKNIFPSKDDDMRAMLAFEDVLCNKWARDDQKEYAEQRLIIARESIFDLINNNTLKDILPLENKNNG
jgi:hypothetical protein